MNKWQQTNNDNKLVKIRENVGCFMGYSPATRCLGLLQNGRFPFAPPQKKKHVLMGIDAYPNHLPIYLDPLNLFST